MKLPIDPFSDAYWPGADFKPAEQPSETVLNGDVTLPQRQPLQARPNIAINGTVNILQGKSVKKAKVDKPADQAPRLLGGPELEAFKTVVSGSEHNKTVLLGLLKKRSALACSLKFYTADRISQIPKSDEGRTI